MRRMNSNCAHRELTFVTLNFLVYLLQEANESLFLEIGGVLCSFQGEVAHALSNDIDYLPMMLVLVKHVVQCDLFTIRFDQDGLNQKSAPR